MADGTADRKSQDPALLAKVLGDSEVPLFDLAVDAANVGAAALDAQGNYLAINDLWAKLLRLKDDADLVGACHFDIAFNILNQQEFMTVFAGTPYVDQLAQTYDQDDNEIVLRWSAYPVDLSNVACIVIVRELVRTEAETHQLVQDRDRLRFALDGADYGLWDWNVVTGEVFFSARFMAILGYEQYELPHEYDTWAHFCRPGDVVDYDEAVQDFVAAGDSYLEDEFEMRCKDGSYVWILSRGKVVSRRPDGSPLRIVGTHQDITVQKEREFALRSAKEEAEQANKAKSDFLALISHEVRTPLNGITSVLELLGDEEDAAERKRLSQIALNSSDQLLTVLSDVLDVSKMEAGRFDLHPRPVKLVDMVEELTQTHARAAEAKGLKFLSSLAGAEDLVLLLDPVRVNQILNNFLSNAIKFTEAGEVALDIDVDASYEGMVDDQPAVFISVAVRDDGVGLTPSERERLFQPFYQAEGTRSRSSEGTGLGLSICKRLAGMMGGHVWCASKKGFGSTFYFEAAFPVVESLEDHAGDTEETDTGSDATTIRILAAEDNPVNQMVLKKFLIDRLGYPVRLVSNGKQALAALEEEAFDLILMDIHMPEMDGVTAAKAIRSSGGRFGQVPIIALTADAAEAHVEEYKAVGIDACAEKPIKWDELDKLIKAVFEAKTGIK